jgi:hypothetical protein
MHFFKAFTLLATVAFAAVAVALPADGNAIACAQAVDIFNNISATVNLIANGG